jgi:hypothetical protein
MGDFRHLSVAEDHDHIDRISGIHRGVYFSIDYCGKLIIEGLTSGKIITIEQVEIDELITYLQTAKQFIEEAKIMRKLKGMR